MTQISPEGRSKLRAYETQVMKKESRYLTAFELSRCMRNPPKNPNDAEIGRMEAWWFAYEREILWHGRKFEEEHPDVQPFTLLEEIYKWEDHAVTTYVRCLQDRPHVQQISNGERPPDRMAFLDM